MLSNYYSRTLTPIQLKKAIIAATITILAIAAISLFISIFVGASIYKYFSGQESVIEPLNKGLEALNRGEINIAYEKYTSRVFKNNTKLSEFTELVEGSPQIFKSKEADFDKVDVRNNQATVSGTITGQDGTVTPLVFNLVLEKDHWLILGFRQGVN